MELLKKGAKQAFEIFIVALAIPFVILGAILYPAIGGFMAGAAWADDNIHRWLP